MKRVCFSILVLVLLMSFVGACGDSGKEKQTDDLTARARDIVGSLEKGDFVTPTKSFDATMKRELAPDGLKKAWESLVEKMGAFEAVTVVRKEKSGGYDIVYVTCRFEKGSVDVKVVFDKNKQIGGLFFVPSSGASEYEAPQYVKPDSFTEKEVTVGTGEWKLPGTLSMPKGAGPFPAVVLVHGSGPNDRDETIGPNKTFKDLALGLASQGVAVLRYEKRTKEYQQKVTRMLTDMTVQQETIDDALAAVSLLRETERIDSGRVFVLGHSLGGMLIPRIAAQGPDIRGFIILAGANEPLEDAVLRQMIYIFGLDGTTSPEESSQLDKVKVAVAKVKDPGLSESTPAIDLPLGMPAKYWLDLRGYDPAEAAKTITRPVLILQGERDYQVTMAEFGRWKSALAGKGNVTFKSYPDLNHLFIPGEGQSTPDEYKKAGHVPVEVVDDIAEFVKSH